MTELLEIKNDRRNGKLSKGLEDEAEDINQTEGGTKEIKKKRQ